MSDWRRPTLNEKPLGECYAFELGWIVENRRADGFHGSRRRVAEARAELQRRVDGGDDKAAKVLAEIEGGA